MRARTGRENSHEVSVKSISCLIASVSSSLCEDKAGSTCQDCSRNDPVAPEECNDTSRSWQQRMEHLNVYLTIMYSRIPERYCSYSGGLWEIVKEQKPVIEANSSVLFNQLAPNDFSLAQTMRVDVIPRIVIRYAESCKSWYTTSDTDIILCLHNGSMLSMGWGGGIFLTEKSVTITTVNT